MRRACAQPPPAAPADRADALFAEGNHAYDAGAFGIAADKYGAAFALKKTHDIAANLGAAELKLKKFAAAANHFAFAIRNHPPTGDPKRRAALEAKLAEARAQAVAITITAPAGAEVLVDGVAVGTAPLADTFFAEPGEHRVEARLGAKRGEASVRGAAAEAKAIEVVLAAESGTAPAVPPTTPPSVPPGETGDGPPVWPGLVIGGVGVAALGVGLGLFLSGEGAASDGLDTSARITDAGGSCEPPVGPGSESCASAQDDFDSASGLQTVGAVTMSIGGSAIAGGVAYLIWSAIEASPADARLVPWIGTDVAGGGVTGRF